jgi:hypothetical protein
MVGSKVDQSVFEFLISDRLPKVHEKLEELWYEVNASGGV